MPPQDKTVPPQDKFVPPVDTTIPPDLKYVLNADGNPCTGDHQCYSGHCADGVCCDRACTSACSTCKSPQKPGQCVPVAFGDKPPAGKTCTVTPPDSCGADGACDGAGACRYWSGNVCKPAKCDSSSKTKVMLAWACDGKGTCADLSNLASAVDCKTYRCDSSAKACFDSCSKNSECESGKTCVGGKCDGKALPQGATCSDKSQCESGKCIEGVCCDSDCKEPCKTCVRDGARGVCAPAAAGNKPTAGKTCVVKLPCAEDGRCDGVGKCRKAPSGTTCGTPVCALDKTGYIFKVLACDGNGGCKEVVSPCGTYTCQPGNKSCYGRCLTTSQCLTPNTCSAHLCN